MDANRLAAMQEATRLTRAGRLTEATALIQRTLAGRGDPVPSKPTTTAPLQTCHSRRPRPRRHEPRRHTSPEPGASASPQAGRPYRLHLPAGDPNGPLPLVMMLHGGTQDGADFAAATRLDGFADRFGFVVVYPEQITSANPMRYWNWFSPNDQRLGTGEPAILVDIVERIATAYPIDRSRIYVAGFSAGAAMAAVLAATYPDVFAAACVHSGLPHGVATDLRSAFAAMKHPSPTRRVSQPVPMLVIHGDADRIVAPGNAAAVIAQHAPSPTSDTVVRVRDGLAYSRRLVSSATGHRHEQFTVHGLGHAWSGGAPDASYTEPKGPDASAALVRFFGLDVATARCRPV